MYNYLDLHYTHYRYRYMQRSPYGYTTFEWVANIFVPFGFVSVGQDMRGTRESEGHFSLFHDEPNDGEV